MLSPSKTYYNDWRLRNVCAYCGDYAETEDHVPSKCFLDKPLPENPPVVPCCHKCNASFTEDEEYVFCLIECMKSRTTDPLHLDRIKARETLLHSNGLRHRIEKQYRNFGGVTLWDYERPRLECVIRKLALGHLAYEKESLFLDSEFMVLICKRLDQMTTTELACFESPYFDPLLLGVGSRLLTHTFLLGGSGCAATWQIVQPNRYRYCASSDGHKVKFVIS